MRAFLIGGGRDPEGVVASHAPFVAAAGGDVVAFVLDEGEDTDVERWKSGLEAAGAGAVRAVVVSEARPPQADDLDGAGGIYVAGGWTPGYQEVLAGAGTAWLADALRRGTPFAGFSAGAAIAAGRALVGGWRASGPDGTPFAVCDEDAGEDLDLLEVRDGLGLVPFTVDVHAAQWGTLGRLVSAVLGHGLGEGYAIDEATCLEWSDGTVRVHGEGAAHHVLNLGDGSVSVAVLRPTG